MRSNNSQHQIMEDIITNKALRRVYHMIRTYDGEIPYRPILQVLKIKKLSCPQPSNRANHKWKLFVSDGTYHLICVARDTDASLFSSGTVRTGTIFELYEFAMSVMTNSIKLCRIIQMVVLMQTDTLLKPIEESKNLNLINITDEVLQQLEDDV